MPSNLKNMTSHDFIKTERVQRYNVLLRSGVGPRGFPWVPGSDAEKGIAGLRCDLGSEITWAVEPGDDK